MITTAIILTVLGACYIFINQRKFGRMPSGNRLKRIKNSPHYRNGKFENLSLTPDLTEGATILKVVVKFLFGKGKRNKPASALPSVKTDLPALDLNENILIWFGHSSYFMQLDGKNFLVDPVFSGAASPIRATTRSFPGSDIYTPDDFREIDFLILSHDHWDHLDYKTIVKLKPKVKSVICGLGLGAHLEHWKYDPEIIIEKDWNEQVDLGGGFTINTTPARHFAGRGIKRNQSLWLSFVLQTPTKNIYLGGDSGYGFHFKKIGDAFGPFDLAILECGQYNEFWKNIHMMPEEWMLAAKDLQAKAVMPVHWGKFALGMHDWDEPIIRINAAAKGENITLLTPMIGEKVNLNAPQLFESWWKAIG